ncbi:hypothetical protein TrRE_jg12461, partial [Triparma retinervis]
MEPGSLCRGTSHDGTTQVDGRFKLTIDPNKYSTLDHLWDPADPSQCVEGMRALALFPDDSDYYAGRIGTVVEGGSSFEFLFDDGDVLPSTTSSLLKLLPLPELLIDKDAVRVGMTGQCYYREENELYEGAVGADNGDGTYRFDFDDGDVAPSVYLHDLSHLVENVTEKILDEAAEGGDASSDAGALDEFLNDDDQNPYGDDFDVSDDDIDIGETSPTTDAPTPAVDAVSHLPPATTTAVASTTPPPKPLAQSNSDLNILLTNTTGVPAPDSSSPPKPETTPQSSPSRSPRPLEESYVDSQSHLHPLLIPPNPLASDTGPAERLQALAQEYVDLEFSYLNALNTSINHRADDGAEEQLPPPPQDTFAAPPPPSNADKQPLLVNSMTALKMRSKALSTLLYGDDTLETVQEAIDLATCYCHNHLWVQTSLHAKASLSVLDKDMSDQLEIPNILCKNSATALLHLFDSIRTVFSKCKPDTLVLKDLVTLLEGPAYMENIVSDIKDIESSSATGVEQHAFPTSKLVTMLRKMDGYRLCVNAVERSLRPYQLSLLKRVVANVEGLKPEGLSAPDASELIKGFRSTNATYTLVEGSEVISKLGQILLSHGEDGDDEDEIGTSRLTRVFYEEALSLLALSGSITSRETWASHLRVQALTLIGRSLFSQNKFSGSLDKFAAARKLIDAGGREDCLSSCSMLAGFSDALVAQATIKGRKKKKGGRGKLKDAMEFEAPTGKEDGEEAAAAAAATTITGNLTLADELLTHNFDIIESCFGTSHIITARACCDVAFLAVVREKYDEGLEFLHKAFEIFRKVEAVGGAATIGIGAASTSISIGRLKMKMGGGVDEESGLSEIKYGAEYYRDVGDAKGYALFNELARIYEKNAGCIDYDAVECLENSVACAVGAYGKTSSVTFFALKKLGDKSEEGGDFERAISAYKKAFRCGEVVFGGGDVRTKRVLRLIRKLKGGEEKKEEAVGDEDGHKGSAFFHEEKKAAKEFLAKEEERIKKKAMQGKRRKRKKKRVVKKKAAAVVEEKSVGEEMLGVAAADVPAVPIEEKGGGGGGE